MKILKFTFYVSVMNLDVDCRAELDTIQLASFCAPTLFTKMDPRILSILLPNYLCHDLQSYTERGLREVSIHRRCTLIH